jgi:hypothetical protein
MNLVETVAPISIENLKKYFTDKTTFFVINYKDSSLKGAKLLTYLSNLDVPCDIDLSHVSEEDCYGLLKDYLQSPMIVNIPSLEMFTIMILSQVKGLRPVVDAKFIDDNKETLDKWVSKLDSLTIYNMSIVNDENFKNFAKQFPEDPTDELAGVNFVSLLKRPEFYDLYATVDKDQLKYYTHYFNDYMFKGKSLYTFWATENNPLFMLTYGISEGMFTPEEYNNAKKQSLEELVNAAPV